MTTTWELHEMDCRLAMGMLMDADSVDSIVCDPPYGLSKEPDMAEVLTHWLNGDDYTHGGSGFMGKSWDSFVPGPSVWREAYRVLKPGGHLVAFFGTRTYDLGVLALRLAGFEIRDQLAWVFGSGFPKSHDVSKGIDKARVEDVEPVRVICRAIRAAMDTAGLKSKDLAPLFDCHSRLVDHWAARDTDSQPTLPTWSQWEILRDFLGMGGSFDCEVRRLNERKGEAGDVYQEAEILGEHAGSTPGFGEHRFAVADSSIRAPSALAAQWQGWGTALKPAYEPIVLARKPLVGTVARNVLSHGTGALNIDGCRVGDEGGTKKGSAPAGTGNGIYGAGLHGACDIVDLGKGRWPANLAHDGSPEVLAEFPVTSSGKMKAGTVRAAQDEPGSVCYGTFGGRATDSDTPGDSGSTARFFKSCPIDDEDAEAARLYYCAKASKSDRNEGLDDLPEQPSAASEFRPNHTEGAAAGKDGNPYGRWSPVRNTHPTVKPTALMQWLVRLVTPPGGLVLDPFTGSGSTGKAAMLEGFSFVGCEMDPDYAKIARLRIDGAVNSR